MLNIIFLQLHTFSPVTPVHAGRIASVEQSIIKRFALVCQHLLDLRRPVDQNAVLVLNAH